MDAVRFDALARALGAAGPRRRAITGLLGGTLGLLGAPGADHATAHDALKKCKKIEDKKKRKKCVKRAKKHNAGHAAGAQPECTTHEECDDGQFCNGEERCGEDGTCRPGTPPSCDDGNECTVDGCDAASGACTHAPDDSLCDDGFACTYDSCDPQIGCVSVADDQQCASANPCLVGRCDPSDPNRDQDGCVFDAVTGGSVTCGIGPCQRTVQRCIDGEEQPCVPGQPSAEICNGIDDDCDGLVDEGAICPTGQRCQGGGCCKVDGFGAEHACTGDAECCSGNCATHYFGRTCRPAGCLPTGGDCSGSASVCCSVTCGGGKCQ